MAEDRLILLVEDDSDIRESIADALEDEGYAVVVAIDGLDALERLQSTRPPPGLILLDLMMPRMNGTQFCQEKQKVPEWSGIPIVVLSADAQVRERAEACRAASYLKKPVKLSVLFETVARVLGAASAGASS